FSSLSATRPSSGHAPRRLFEHSRRPGCELFSRYCARRRPTRELAAMLGVANGTVARVIDDLARLGFLTTLGRRDRRLHNLKGLLERWVMMYPVHSRPTLLRRRLTTDEPDWWKNETF